MYGGRLGGSSSLLLGAGESLQTMVFPQPVDEEKEEMKGEQYIPISLMKMLQRKRETFQWRRRIRPDGVDPDEPGGVTWVVVTLHVHAAATESRPREKRQVRHCLPSQRSHFNVWYHHCRNEEANSPVPRWDHGTADNLLCYTAHVDPPSNAACIVCTRAGSIPLSINTTGPRNAP